MEKYSSSMKVMHWLMSAMILTLLTVGLWMESLPGDYPDKYYYYGIHKSFGMIALVFIILRLSIRMRSKIPALPKKINRFDSLLSSATILVLYLCMFAMPMSGYLMSEYGDHPVGIFGYMLPELLEKNFAYAKFFRAIHGYAAFTLIGLICLHVAGSFKHLFFEKVNLFRRMW